MATTTDAPFGFRPVKTIDASSVRVGYYKVASGAARIFKGDLVELNAGFVRVAQSTSGPFLGIAAKDSGGTAPAGGISDFPVWDSPNLVFEAQLADASSTAQADLQSPRPAVLTTGDTNTGLSKHEIDIDSTAVAGIRVLRLSGQPDNALQDGGVVECMIDNHTLA